MHGSSLDWVHKFQYVLIFLRMRNALINIDRIRI